jgi:hypothetical protein
MILRGPDVCLKPVEEKQSLLHEEIASGEEEHPRNDFQLLDLVLIRLEPFNRAAHAFFKRNLCAPAE